MNPDSRNKNTTKRKRFIMADLNDMEYLIGSMVSRYLNFSKGRTPSGYVFPIGDSIQTQCKYVRQSINSSNHLRAVTLKEMRKHEQRKTNES